MMTRTLSELLALVKQLREEVGQQRNEISYLRQLIENCAGCKEQSAPLRDTCQSNPCYPGIYLANLKHRYIYTLHHSCRRFVLRY